MQYFFYFILLFLLSLSYNIISNITPELSATNHEYSHYLYLYLYLYQATCNLLVLYLYLYLYYCTVPGTRYLVVCEKRYMVLVQYTVRRAESKKAFPDFGRVLNCKNHCLSEAVKNVEFISIY
jgi:hypothetical protein